jgi:hypothetical protein
MRDSERGLLDQAAQGGQGVSRGATADPESGRVPVMSRLTSRGGSESWKLDGS